MRRIHYFERATRVKFYDKFSETFEIGIGFHEFVIDGRNGNAYLIDELMAEAPDGIAAVIEEKWKKL